MPMFDRGSGMELPWNSRQSTGECAPLAGSVESMTL